MGLYQRLFASCMAHADTYQRELYGARKRALLGDVHGTVLEIGPGTGVNLPYFPRDVRWIGVEPNRHMHAYIREKAAQLDLEVTLTDDSAEALPFEDGTMDAVVCTLVLCSVPNLERVLAEVSRVLRAGAPFYFIEHVAAERGTWLRRVQHLIKPAWRVVADGCRPDRDTHHALEAAGFRDVRYEHFRIDVPLSPITPHIAGVATR